MNALKYIKTKINILKYDFSSIKRYRQLLNLILNQKPKSIIEIGVYKGLRSAQMLNAAKVYNNGVDFYGFDLFEDFYSEDKILDKELSKKPNSQNKIYDYLKNYGQINLYKGFTHDTLPKFIDKKLKVDFIFIDGGHSIETIKNDWLNVSKMMHEKTIVVFDDFYHDDKELVKSFGCNDVILNLDKKYKVTYLPIIDKIDKNKLKIQLVQVTL